MTTDPQQTWTEYYERIRKRRLAEAPELWAQMTAAGVSADTTLALDFLHFSSDRNNADALRAQLSENYEVSVTKAPDPDYWHISGTTRPYGITLSEQDHLDWVEFMCDVAHSHGCVFSTWALEDPRTKQSWSNEGIETE